MSGCSNPKMRKSPLNSASGSKTRHGGGWKPHEHKNRLGYAHDNYQPPNGGRTQCGTDFIPLNVSTPLPEQKRHNWHAAHCGGRNNQRNSGSGGFNHYRNNYHSPKANFNNSYSPYKLSGKPFYAQKKVYQKDARKQVDISSYVDAKSFLEDPWADLVEKLNRSREISGIE